MDDRFNTPHTDKIELEFLGHNLLLAQDPNSKHIGTTVWDASMVFVKFLELNCKKGEFSSSRLTGKKVIEVGAGCGLAGLGMAFLGCNVVATDQIEVLPLLLRNVERNMARAKHSTSESPYLGSLGTIQVAELEWGNQQHIRAVNPPFDYIIGTDIVYKEQLLEPLLATFLCLAGPGTSILLGYEFRSSTVHEKMQQLWKDNFNVKTIPKSKMDSKYQHVNIHIFNMRPKVFGLIILQGQDNKEAIGEQSEFVVQKQSSKEATEPSLERDYLEDASSLDVLEHVQITSSNSSVQETLDISKDEIALQIHEGDEKLGLSPVNGHSETNSDLEDSSCSPGLNDWEIRRLGSMAARLLQDVL